MHKLRFICILLSENITLKKTEGDEQKTLVYLLRTQKLCTDFVQSARNCLILQLNLFLKAALTQLLFIAVIYNMNKGPFHVCFGDSQTLNNFYYLLTS